MSKYDFLSDGAMDAEKFMEKHSAYKTLKRADLENIPESEAVRAVTSWIEGKFSEDRSDMCDVINSLPTPCLNIYCADYISQEITGGGFCQAFFNTSRDFIGAAAAGFRAVGLQKAADVIEEALKINYDSGTKITGRSFEDFLAFSTSGEYDKQDKMFNDVFDRSEFNALAYKYIMKYQKYFGEE